MKLIVVILASFVHTITADRLDSEHLPNVNENVPDETSSFPPLIHEISDSPINILRYNNINGADGSYKYDYETGNKISHTEVGYLKNVGTGRQATVARGSYSYFAPNGERVTVDYIADENGFQPIGSHILSPQVQTVTAGNFHYNRRSRHIM